MELLGIIVVCMIVYYLLMGIRRKLFIGGYNDRHVLITGCDTGFGHLVALRLDEMGIHVFAGCLMEKGEDDLRKKGSSTLKAFHFDVTQARSIQGALEYVKSRLPPGKGLWGVVNNAGIAGPGYMCPDEWLTKQDYEKTLAVNLFGTIETTRAFLPLVRKEKGRIVITTSMAGLINMPNEFTYGISKHALESYANTLRMSARMYGVSVHTLWPVGFSTALTDPEINSKTIIAVWARLDPEIQQFYGQEYLHQLIQTLKKGMSYNSSDPSPVVKANVHALTARYPQTHYRVGRDAHISLRLISWTPTWIADYLWTLVSPTPAGVNN